MAMTVTSVHGQESRPVAMWGTCAQPKDHAMFNSPACSTQPKTIEINRRALTKLECRRWLVCRA